LASSARNLDEAIATPRFQGIFSARTLGLNSDELYLEDVSPRDDLEVQRKTNQTSVRGKPYVYKPKLQEYFII
jgi:hypothetical protein